MGDYEMVPIRNVLSQLLSENALLPATVEAALLIFTNVFSTWKRVGVRGRAILFGYTDFPPRKADVRSVNGAAENSSNGSSERDLSGAQNPQSIPQNLGQSASSTLANLRHMGKEAHGSVIGDAEGGNLQPRVEASDLITAEERRPVLSATDRLILSASNDYIFKHLKKVLDPANEVVFGVVAKAWVEKEKLRRKQSPPFESYPGNLATTCTTSTVEKKIYQFALERTAPRPRQYVLQKRRDDLESITRLLIAVRRFMRLELYENMGWPGCVHV